MKWVLLRINDNAIEGFVRKAGRRVIWVGEIPDKFCTCEVNEQKFLHWKLNEETRHPSCIDCGLPHEEYVRMSGNLGIRLRYALGRNILDRLRS
jgi:hypothetical protein